MDVFVEENDINLKICYFDNIVIETKPSQFNKFVFENIDKINNYDSSRWNNEKVYWQE